MTHNDILNKIHQHQNILNSLPTIKYNKDCLEFNSIKTFYRCSKRNDNDSDNKIRENILGAIINQKVPEQYYSYSPSWRSIRDGVSNFISKLLPDKEIKSISCWHKGGRKYCYDLELHINDKIFYIEFKFNVTKVDECPQFSSPSKPSNFLDTNFEKYFYDNYLHKISEFGTLPMPDKNIYLETINNNKVECMKTYKTKYNTDTKFREHCSKIDKKAIKEFINSATLDVESLSEYLLQKQKNKIYMCFKDGQFYKDTIDDSNFIITNLVKKTPNSFICNTKNNINLEIRLRFKNGLGLQFPAFQIKRIKRKMPIKKDLQKLCESNSINFNKSDSKVILIKLLNDKGITF